MSHCSLYIPDQEAIVQSLRPGDVPLLGSSCHHRESARRWYFKDYHTSTRDSHSELDQSDDEGDDNNHGGDDDDANEDEAHVDENKPEPVYRTSSKAQPPVAISLSKRVTNWELDLRKRHSCLYSIVLGISIGSAKVDQIESIEFRVYDDEYTATYPSEIFNKQDIQELFSAGHALARWRLHQQFKKDKYSSSIRMEMEIRTTTPADKDSGDSSADSLGAFDLHYLEIVKEPSGSGSFGHYDPSLKVHRPYVWSINVNLSDELSEDLMPTMDIVTYAISGDGTHVATVAACEQHVFLDVWDLKNPQKFHTDHTNHSHVHSIHNTHSRNKSKDKIDTVGKESLASIPSKDPPYLLSDTITTTTTTLPQALGTPGILRPFQPRCSARVSAIELPETYRGRLVGVSLSWDASYVALLDATSMSDSPEDRQQAQSAFAIFDHVCGPHATISEKGHATPFAPTVLRASEQHHLDLAGGDGGRLRNFFGYGKFHISAVESPDVKDELFVTCNEEEVNVYRVYPKWHHVHTVRLDRPYSRVFELHMSCQRLISTLHGRSFAWDVQNHDGIAVWDVEDGSMVSFSLKHRVNPSEYLDMDDTPFCLSNDGKVLAVYQERVISTHWVGSGTLRSKYVLPDRYVAPKDLQFIRGDTQIMVRLESRNENLGRGYIGLIIQVEGMVLVDSFAIPGKYLALPSTTSSASQDLMTACQSTLDFIRLEDRIAVSWSNPKPVCDDRCLSNLEVVNSDDRHDEITSPSGIRYKIESCMEILVTLTNEIHLTSVHVSASFENGTTVDKLVIPEIQRHMYGGQYMEKFFLDCGTRLVVASRELFMVWSLPSTLEGDMKLLAASWVNDGQWHCCPHQELFATDLYIVINEDGSPVRIVCPRVGDGLTRETEENFLKAIYTLTDLYKEAEDKTCRREILRYVGKHINTHPVPEDPKKSILPYLCDMWSLEDHDKFQLFISDLLESPFGRWVPKQDFDQVSNPIWIMLQKSRTQPRAAALVETLIDYCIRQARAENDPHFLVPVMNCLHDLIDPKQPHQELAQRTLRRLAYIPVKSRSLVVDHHRVAFPLEVRWKFWTPNARPLYECKRPVMQMTTQQNRDPVNENFTTDLYVTSDELLWSLVRKGEMKERVGHAPQVLVKAVRPSGVFTWIKALLIMAWYKRKLWSQSAIECHSFNPKAFDHPAIAAIVEYKWNKIGFKYWLMRFFFQCLYYLLVLVAVFLQVYDDQGDRMAGIFVAIVAVSGILLWLEVIQMIRDRKSYLSSVYNFVDLMVIALPLAGSINQLCIVWGKTSIGGNPALLSFSVLFIFLHFLFELRVNKTVCHFVTIIIQIFEKIRVFFFIFAGGILAFTIAILHLLRSCIGGPQNCTETEFPRHFFRAMSATYFFMGGIYDPISPLFNTDLWAFHLMMIVFFLFTVILMLNVLISLISLAFSDRDETWRLTWIENRLRYVESAENMSYHIPGFRDAHSWFPKEIYYSATPQQVREYNKESESLAEQSSIVPDKETTPSSRAVLGAGAIVETTHTHSHSHLAGHDHKEGEEVETPAAAGATTATSEMAQLKIQLQESQGQMLLLLERLTKQQEQNVAQQAQLREQQESFATQLGELQGHILTLLNSKAGKKK
ncbi:hypothetical protein BGX23_001287 [Mortierella sp. AD031]|nr:hypothetical protein BGX23_001287 [Mortierella sp. AD031]